MRRIVYAFILLVLLCVPSSAQDCYDVYSKAKESYESGRINEAIDLLEPCLGTISDLEEKFEAYKLLAMAFQKNNEYKDMEYYIGKMLSLKPDYQKYPNTDPDEFTRAVKKFQVVQTWEVGASVGSFVTSILSHNSFSTLDYPQRYESTAGFQLGAIGDYRLSNKLKIETRLQLGGFSILHLINPDENWYMTYSENFRTLDIVGLGKYNLPVNSSFRPYASAGLGLGILLRSRSFFIYRDQISGIRDQESSSSIAQLTKFLPTIDISAGFEFDLDRGTVELELGYKAFMTNTVRSGHRYDDESFIFNTSYVRDDVKLQQLGINVKYRLPLRYNVTK